MNISLLIISVFLMLYPYGCRANDMVSQNSVETLKRDFGPEYKIKSLSRLIADTMAGMTPPQGENTLKPEEIEYLRAVVFVEKTESGSSEYKVINPTTCEVVKIYYDLKGTVLNTKNEFLDNDKFWKPIIFLALHRIASGTFPKSERIAADSDKEGNAGGH